jgi:hypothetical protein
LAWIFVKIRLKFTLKIEIVVADFTLEVYLWKLRKEKVGGRKQSKAKILTS